MRCVVLMVMLEVTAVVPLGVTEVGEAEHVASAGSPLHVRATPELNPDAELTLTVTLAVFPATTLAEVGLMDRLKSAPPPVSATAWGLLGAESVIVKAPVRVPTTLGVKVTLIVQEAPAARLAVQVLV